jgi:hypothetical protein
MSAICVLRCISTKIFPLINPALGALRVITEMASKRKDRPFIDLEDSMSELRSSSQGSSFDSESISSTSSLTTRKRLVVPNHSWHTSFLTVFNYKISLGYNGGIIS